MSDQKKSFLVEGTIEDAYERARLAWEGIARSQVEDMSPPDWQDLIDFFISLNDESDRAIPILAFAFIDSEIERQMREAVNSETHGGVDSLFGALGPLGSASTRINMAHALHWLTSETVQDLHLLRKIRNRFAHNRVPEGFEDQQTVDLVANHQFLPRILIALLPDLAEEPANDQVSISVRSKIVAAAALTAWTTMAQLYVAPASMRSGVNPSALLNSKSPSAPEGIVAQNELFREMIDSLVLRVLFPDSTIVTGESPPE